MFLYVTLAVFMHHVLSIVCAVALVLIVLPNVNFLRLMFVNKLLIFGKNENSPYCTFTRIKNHCFSDVCLCVTYTPLPSNRHHRRCGDCLEGKGENYQFCSVQYCVQQLCTVRCTHT